MPDKHGEYLVFYELMINGKTRHAIATAEFKELGWFHVWIDHLFDGVLFWAELPNQPEGEWESEP